MDVDSPVAAVPTGSPSERAEAAPSSTPAGGGRVLSPPVSPRSHSAPTGIGSPRETSATQRHALVKEKAALREAEKTAAAPPESWTKASRPKSKKRPKPGKPGKSPRVAKASSGTVASHGPAVSTQRRAPPPELPGEGTANAAVPLGAALSALVLETREMDRLIKDYDRRMTERANLLKTGSEEAVKAAKKIAPRAPKLLAGLEVRFDAIVAKALTGRTDFEYLPGLAQLKTPFVLSGAGGPPEETKHCFDRLALALKAVKWATIDATLFPPELIPAAALDNYDARKIGVKPVAGAGAVVGAGAGAASATAGASGGASAGAGAGAGVGGAEGGAEDAVLATRKRFGAVVDEDLCFEPPHAPPLPPRPTPIFDTLGLGHDEFSTVLAIWDFLRSSAKIRPDHPAVIFKFGAEYCGDMTLKTALKTPGTFADIGSLGRGEPLPLPFVDTPYNAANAAVALAGGAAVGPDMRTAGLPSGSVGTSVPVPATADFTLANFVAGLRGTDMSAWRLLSRVHISLLRFLIKDKEKTCQARTKRRSDDEWAVERVDKTTQDTLGADYDNTMGERERDLGVAEVHLNTASWPEVFRRVFLWGPAGAYLRPSTPPGFLPVLASLADRDYLTLSLHERILLLRGLVDAVNVTDSFGNLMMDIMHNLNDQGKGFDKEEAEAKRVLAESIKAIKDATRVEEKAFEVPMKAYFERSKLKSTNRRRKTASDAERWGLPILEDSGERAMQDQRIAIYADLDDAIKEGSISALRGAIRRAKDSGYLDPPGPRNAPKASRPSSDPELAHAQLKLFRLEQAAEEAAVVAEAAAASEKRTAAFYALQFGIALRPVCLGEEPVVPPATGVARDERERVVAVTRTYWVLASDASRIYVEERTRDIRVAEKAGAAAEVASRVAIEKLSAAAEQEREERERASPMPAAADGGGDEQVGKRARTDEGAGAGAGDDEDEGGGAGRSGGATSLLGLSVKPSAAVAADDDIGGKSDGDAAGDGEGAGGNTIFMAASKKKGTSQGVLVNVASERVRKEFPSSARAAAHKIALYSAHTTASTTWSYYDAWEDVAKLRASLDRRGVKADALATNLTLYETVLKNSMARTAVEANLWGHRPPVPPAAAEAAVAAAAAASESADGECAPATTLAPLWDKSRPVRGGGGGGAGSGAGRGGRWAGHVSAAATAAATVESVADSIFAPVNSAPALPVLLRLSRSSLLLYGDLVAKKLAAASIPWDFSAWKSRVLASLEPKSLARAALDLESAAYEMQRRWRRARAAPSRGAAAGAGGSNNSAESQLPLSSALKAHSKLSRLRSVEAVADVSAGDRDDEEEETPLPMAERLPSGRAAPSPPWPEAWSDGDEPSEAAPAAVGGIPPLESVQYGAWARMRRLLGLPTSTVSKAILAAPESLVIPRSVLLTVAVSPVFPEVPADKAENRYAEDASSGGDAAVVMYQYRSARRWWRVRMAAVSTPAALALELIGLASPLYEADFVPEPDLLKEDIDAGVEKVDDEAEDVGAYSKPKRAAALRAGLKTAAAVRDESEADETEDERLGPQKKRRAAIPSDTDDEKQVIRVAKPDDTCTECTLPANAEDGVLLACSGCTITAHSKCLGVRAPTRERIFFCTECKKNPCSICKMVVPAAQSILCGPDGGEGCGHVYHLSCVGLKRAPKDDWFCDKCGGSD